MHRNHIKSRWRTPLSAASLTVFVVAFTYIFLNFFGPVQKAATWLDDFRLAYLTPLIAQNTDIAVLEIDEETLSTMPYRSPIDRQFIADLIEQLGEHYSVRAIGLDIIFDQATIEEHDLRLQAVMRDSPVPVVVAVGAVSARLSDNQIAFQSQYLDEIRKGSAVLTVEGGVVRTHYPHDNTEQTVSFVNSLALSAGFEPPTEPTGIIFRRGAANNALPFPVFPANRIGILPKNWLKNKVVLIGANLSDQDQHRTPLSVLGDDYAFMAGVMIHAQILAQITTSTYLPVPSERAVFLILIAAVVAGISLALSSVPARMRLLLGIAIFSAYWLAAFSSNVFWKFPLPILGPSIGFLLAATAATALARQEEHRQRLFLHSAFNQYVSSGIIDDIIANPDHLRLGGEAREMSFIFTDIAGFSTLAERASPDEVVQLLSGYLDGLVEIALRHGGTIARFAGDGLVIFFGAPLSQDDHSSRSVQCALEIDVFCESYKSGQQQTKHGFGITRIGVHSGTAVVGNVGGKRRFEYTAHGDCVNTAARLESANRHFGTRLCISQDAANSFANVEFRPIGLVVLKGKSIPLELFTIWDDYDVPSRLAYMRIYEMMSELDPRAEGELTRLADRLPQDDLVALHLSRYRAGEIGVEFELREK
jgi:adenylate cyclase